MTATVAERLAEITDLTEITVQTADEAELIRAFNKLFGRGVRIDRRWSLKRLREEVSGAIIRKMAEFIRQDEEAAKKAAFEAELTARAAARGTWEEFANAWRNDSVYADPLEQKLAYASWDAIRTRKVAKAQIAKFAEEVVKNPSYALSWSLDRFKSAAKIEVAARLEAMVVGGYSAEVIKAEVIKNALRLASSNNRSTSPTSNLMEDELRVAWVELARELGFNYY